MGMVRCRDLKWLPKIPSLEWFLNPPKSPVFKGGLAKEFLDVPPFGKGGVGGLRFLEPAP
jgi:hypothetical protein